jgi:DNA-binding PadR family transcriptional regulator
VCGCSLAGRAGDPVSRDTQNPLDRKSHAGARMVTGRTALLRAGNRHAPARRRPTGSQVRVQIYLDLRYIGLYVGSVKHRHRDGSGRRFAHPDDLADRRHGGHHHHRHHGHRSGGRRGDRAFDYGELRLLSLAMIAEAPRHGYELMKAIEERMAGSYSPSPGVIYPTLAWLEDMGYAAVEAAEAGRKRYRITPQGEAFLTANRAAVDELLSRVGPAGRGRPDGLPEAVLQGMEKLKLALRQRMRQGPLAPAAAETIATALDAAVQAVEHSQ